MLLMSSDATLVLLRGGLRPPLFFNNTWVWLCVVVRMLLISSDATLIILRCDLRPPHFFNNTLVWLCVVIRMLLCHRMLLSSFLEVAFGHLFF